MIQGEGESPMEMTGCGLNRPHRDTSQNVSSTLRSACWTGLLGLGFSMLEWAPACALAPGIETRFVQLQNRSADATQTTAWRPGKRWLPLDVGVSPGPTWINASHNH